MISLAEARERIFREVKALAPERVELALAHGRILREAVIAPEDFPGFDRAAMDGYAVMHEDLSGEFVVMGEAQPGARCGVRMGPGQCVRIFTGAVMPEGASQVIMQEDVERIGERVVVRKRSSVLHVRRRGEDARAGALLLGVGVRLGAVQASLLAQVGMVDPLVAARPRVVHLVTGGELVPPAQVPGEGQIRDSNSTLVRGLVEGAGAEMAWQGHAPDELGQFLDRLRAPGEEGWDVLLISGGASVGDYDFGARALAELGFEVRFHGVNLRPGKPLAFATRGRQAAFLLPGNPVSHWVVFAVAVRLALERMQGVGADGEGDGEGWRIGGMLPLALGAALEGGADRRETFWPGRVVAGGGGLRVDPVAWRSSGDLCAIARANALIHLPPGALPLDAGAIVNCVLMEGGALPLD